MMRGKGTCNSLANVCISSCVGMRVVVSASQPFSSAYRSSLSRYRLPYKNRLPRNIVYEPEAIGPPAPRTLSNVDAAAIFRRPRAIGNESEVDQISAFSGSTRSDPPVWLLDRSDYDVIKRVDLWHGCIFCCIYIYDAIEPIVGFQS